MGEKVYVLNDKSVLFAIRIIKLYKYLKEDKNEQVMSKQLLRSGTSIGANISESVYAESSSDYIHKLAIAPKECSETLYWLQILKQTDYLTEKQFLSIDNDCRELIKLLTATILTMKKKNNI